MRHFLLSASLVMLATAAGAQADHQHGAEGRLGVVSFPNSCAPGVQPAFARGMALLHSFEFGPAIDAFREVSGGDPSCGIALWATGLAQWGNPFAPVVRSATQLEAGRASLQKAAGVGAKSAREREFIAAAAVLYDRFEAIDQPTRVRAYRDAMSQLAAKHPDDPEASAFYALALAAAADPADKTYADQLKAGAILEKLWEAQPQHPGLAHYIIHSYDVPSLAPRAVAAARRYAEIAPAAPHALHMPSHTFTRLGYWQDSIDTNILSADAARKAGAVYEELHAMDYEAYAYLQTAQDAKARRLVEALPEIRRRIGPGMTASAAPPTAGLYALAAIPARYALERGAWAEAAALESHPSAVAYADALTWFARALGAARTRDVASARAAIRELQNAIDLVARAKESYWVEQVTIQRLAASAWLALAEGRAQEAVAAMREAADREDRTEKAAVTPGPLAPARELLGDMYLELKQPREALAEFEKTIAKEPNRFRALSRAGAAALQAGDRAAAATYYERLLGICARADVPGRPELETARAAIGRAAPGKR